MAHIKAGWKKLGENTPISEGAEVFREVFKELSEKLSAKGVYIIRFCRPFSIAYPKTHSPVLSIGQGNTRQRVTSHLKSWINGLAHDLSSAHIEVFCSEPRVQNNAKAHLDIEADLLDRFHTKFGALPLFNKRYEYHPRNHDYPDGYFRYLGPGSGKGFNWAISPLESDDYFFRSYEWEE